jgi:hypothetical protein
MHKIIYYSTAVKKMSDGELNDLLTKSRIFNKSKNITGILLYLDGDFVQVIEGEQKDIHELFEKIKVDTRHKNILTMLDAPILEKQFSNWSMGFSNLTYNNSKSIKGLEIEHIEKLKENTDKTAYILINSFLKSHSQSGLI